MRVGRCLEVWKMGTVNYLNALKLQEKLIPFFPCNTHLHTPSENVKTDHNLLVSEPDLKNLGAELYYTQRGGDITFHGPHQAILYPIISLPDIGVGARSYVEKLEQTMIDLASIYGVQARPGHKGETGVWVGDRKIGAIGVRIQHGITSHGLAFNIDPDMKYFDHIVPCGILDKEVTSLRRETNLELPNDEVIQEQLISCFAKLFGFSSVLMDKTEGSNIQ
ncbi:Octanoyltransferase LIP2 mitochondrial [Bienertia sinuspersici]